jgi:hypothetical protein
MTPASSSKDMLQLSIYLSYIYLSHGRSSWSKAASMKSVSFATPSSVIVLFVDGALLGTDHIPVVGVILD